jgi:hypothetical protein
VYIINFVTSTDEKNRRQGFSKDVLCLDKVSVFHSPPHLSYIDLSRPVNSHQHEYVLRLALEYSLGIGLAFKLCLLKRNEKGNMSTY